ncbi:MAG: hypothetical protein HY062_07835 [Bacteroidetes bacterium]|nr:hypothetical protein [Bacteroidota bacterium]
MKLKIPYIIFCICLYKLCTAQNVVEIGIDSLPTHIKQNINRKHSSYQIRYCSKLIGLNNKVSYNIILQKGNKEIDIMYNEGGKIIISKKTKYYIDDETIKENNYKTPFPNL